MREMGVNDDINRGKWEVSWSYLVKKLFHIWSRLDVSKNNCSRFATATPFIERSSLKKFVDITSNNNRQGDIFVICSKNIFQYEFVHFFCDAFSCSLVRRSSRARLVFKRHSTIFRSWDPLQNLFLALSGALVCCLKWAIMTTVSSAFSHEKRRYTDTRFAPLLHALKKRRADVNFSKQRRTEWQYSVIRGRPSAVWVQESRSGVQTASAVWVQEVQVWSSDCFSRLGLGPSAGSPKYNGIAVQRMDQVTLGTLSSSTAFSHLYSVFILTNPWYLWKCFVQNFRILKLLEIWKTEFERLVPLLKTDRL